MRSDTSRSERLLPFVDTLTLAKALSGYEVECRKWSEYLERESKLGRGDKAQEIVDYQFARMLTRQGLHVGGYGQIEERIPVSPNVKSNNPENADRLPLSLFLQAYRRNNAHGLKVNVSVLPNMRETVGLFLVCSARIAGVGLMSCDFIGWGQRYRGMGPLWDSLKGGPSNERVNARTING